MSDTLPALMLILLIALGAFFAMENDSKAKTSCLSRGFPDYRMTTKDGYFCVGIKNGSDSILPMGTLR